MRLGRKNKKYYKDLHQQAYDRLTGMQAFGESKKEAVKNGTDGQKIFSFNTYLSVKKPYTAAKSEAALCAPHYSHPA